MQIGLRVIIGRRSEPVDGKMRIELFDGGELTGELVNARGVDSPMLCLALEYVLQCGEGGLTVAEQRARQWSETRGKGLPWETADGGPYATAVQRLVDSDPTVHCYVDVTNY